MVGIGSTTIIHAELLRDGVFVDKAAMEQLSVVFLSSRKQRRDSKKGVYRKPPLKPCNFAKRTPTSLDHKHSSLTANLPVTNLQIRYKAYSCYHDFEFLVRNRTILAILPRQHPLRHNFTRIKSTPAPSNSHRRPRTGPRALHRRERLLVLVNHPTSPTRLQRTDPKPIRRPRPTSPQRRTEVHPEHIPGLGSVP